MTQTIYAPTAAFCDTCYDADAPGRIKLHNEVCEAEECNGDWHPFETWPIDRVKGEDYEPTYFVVRGDADDNNCYPTEGEAQDRADKLNGYDPLSMYSGAHDFGYDPDTGETVDEGAREYEATLSGFGGAL